MILSMIHDGSHGEFVIDCIEWIWNIDISDSLVNGVTGVIIGYEFRKNPPKYREHLPGSHLHAVIVKFSDPEVGAELRKRSLKNSDLSNAKGKNWKISR